MTESKSSDSRIDAIIADYLKAVAAGTSPDRAALLAQQADLADELKSFFADHDRMHRFVEPPTIGPAPVASGPLGRVRYFGDYELLEEIARGGMGVVYKARQVSLNRVVALKMILAGQLASADDVRRFRTEAEAAANLDHPNILPIYEVGEHEGQHYFSMKFVEGGTLAGWLKKNGTAEYAENAGQKKPRMVSSASSAYSAVKLLTSVARAVHYAHQRGILHRDLKPGNILLDADGTPFVADFGLAKRIEGDATVTHSGALVGTPSYMAPEQARAEKQMTTAIDVYAIGAILYESLTGRPPFQGSNAIETVMQVLDREPDHPCKLNPSADRDLATIAMKCLEKDTARRYESAAALADELERWQRGEPIVARPSSTFNRGWKWVKRKPAVAGSLAFAVVALLAGTAVSAWFAIQQSNTAGNLRVALSSAKGRLAENYMDRGRALCEQGEIGRGMLWFIDSLKEAPTDTLNLQRVIRHNLAAWLNQVHRLNAILPKRQFIGNTAFSPDSKYLLAGESNGSAQLWNVATGEPHGVPFQHDGPIWLVALSPDGRLALTGGADKAVRLWDVATGKLWKTPLLCEGDVTTAAFDPDGAKLVTGSRGKVGQLWDVETCRPIGPPMTSQINVTGPTSGAPNQYLLWTIAFSPNGETIVTGGTDYKGEHESFIQLWKTNTGFPHGEPLRHKGPIRAVAFSRDSKLIATASSDKSAQLWDVATGKAVQSALLHDNVVTSIAFGHDGRTILTGSWDRTARLWETGTSKLRHTLTHLDMVESVAFSPDGRLALSASLDQTARLWDVESGKQLGSALEHTTRVRRANFSPDGQSIVTRGDDTEIRLWHIAQCRPQEKPFSSRVTIQTWAFSPDTTTVATGSVNGVVQLWDVASGKRNGPAMRHDSVVLSAAFSPDSRTIVSGGMDTKARLWSVATGAPIGSPLDHDNYAARAVAFMPDGQSVVTCGLRLHRWDVASGRKLGQPFSNDFVATSLAVHPDGKTILAASGRRAARQFEVSTGQPLEPLFQHQDEVLAVAFSPDGQMALTGSADKTARLWMTETGQPNGSPLLHEDRVGAVAFSRDGKIIATGSRGITRLWDAVSGRALGPPLRRSGNVSGLAFTPDDSTIIVAGVNGLALWPITASLEGSAERIQRLVSASINLRIDSNGVVHVLDTLEWRELAKDVQ